MPGDNLNEPLLPRSNRTPFEWSLSALQPTAEPANSPAILFQAGRSSRDGEVRILKIICAAALLVAVALCLIGLASVFQKDEPTATTPPSTSTNVRDVEPPPSIGYPETPANQSTEVVQLAPPVRQWRPMEQPKVEEPTTDPKDVAEMLYYRRSLLNTGLGLLPTDGPDLTPAAPPRSEK
jgi:hypothetical protein